MSTSSTWSEPESERPNPLTALWRGSSAPSMFEWFFVISGGLVIALPFVFWMGEQALGRADVIRWYFWMNALISSPHVYGTYVRFQRKVNERKVSWWCGFPMYFAIVAALSAVSMSGYFIEVVTAINVWQSYHYLRQIYGVGCLYGRQKECDEKSRKLRFWGYHLVFPALILGRWDTIYQVWGGQTYTFIPVDFSANLMRFMWIIAAIGFYLAMINELRLMIKNKRDYRLLGMINYIVSLAIHTFGFVLVAYYQRGFFAVTIFHAVQYLALVWITERRKAESDGKKWVLKTPNIVGFGMFWLFLFVLGYGFDHNVTTILSSYWAQATTILLIAVSAHHYTIDGFLWRRSVGH
jgi:hypothetical protein